jgi:hypothetical protein
MCHSPFLGPGRNLSSGRTSSDSNSSRGVSDVSKSARRKVRRKISLGLVSRSTVPPGRVHFSLVSRHFVPGYFRLVPPGQNTLFRCRIFLKLALIGGLVLARAEGSRLGRGPTYVEPRAARVKPGPRSDLAFWHGFCFCQACDYHEGPEKEVTGFPIFKRI